MLWTPSTTSSSRTRPRSSSTTAKRATSSVRRDRSSRLMPTFSMWLELIGRTSLELTGIRRRWEDLDLAPLEDLVHVHFIRRLLGIVIHLPLPIIPHVLIAGVSVDM